MLDLSAAFDCVDHDILLSRLQSTFGLEGNVLAWIRSVLSDRTLRDLTIGLNSVRRQLKTFLFARIEHIGYNYHNYWLKPNHIK